MQLKTFPSFTLTLTFDDVVPKSTSTPHVAAAAFYHCLGALSSASGSRTIECSLTFLTFALGFSACYEGPCRCFAGDPIWYPPNNREVTSLL